MQSTRGGRGADNHVQRLAVRSVGPASRKRKHIAHKPDLRRPSPFPYRLYIPYALRFWCAGAAISTDRLADLMFRTPNQLSAKK